MSLTSAPLRMVAAVVVVLEASLPVSVLVALRSAFLVVAGGYGSMEDAVAVVQRMYKEVFLPMALLFLLPGAVFTQLKGLVGQSMLGGGEDSVNPFTGIIRAIIAIFLIPSTQLIVSSCIDT